MKTMNAKSLNSKSIITLIFTLIGAVIFGTIGLLVELSNPNSGYIDTCIGITFGIYYGYSAGLFIFYLGKLIQPDKYINI